MTVKDPIETIEQEIIQLLTELRELLASCSTHSVAVWCLLYHMRISHGEAEKRLTSPAKQIPFLLSVLLSTSEPKVPTEFGKPEWERAWPILERLFFTYMRLYMPTKEQIGRLPPEWYQVREVSMSAFLHYFNSGLLASTHQMEERIKTYLTPFDSEISEFIGISASQALTIFQWIATQLQDTLDKLGERAHEERKARLNLLDKAEDQQWSLDTLREAASASAYRAEIEKLFSEMEKIGIVSLEDLERAFPKIATIFWEQFSVQRGKAPEIRYPTEQAIYEVRPLARIDEMRAFCPMVNGLYTALLLVGERALLQSRYRDKFLMWRDEALEGETLAKIKAFLSPMATIWSKVYDTPDSQYEHDIIAVDNGLCLIIEAKASPPIEPFRDPDKAFIRLRDAFRADRGIQKAFEQGNRVVRKLKAGEAVKLYDKYGREVGTLLTDAYRLPISVCVTRDNFGPLATDLSLLLEKDAADSYPWAVNIIDLSSLAEAWSYFKWGPSELRKYLEQRIVLHGKVISDDELDYAGFFIRHSGFDSAIKTQTDLLQLVPQYSSIFDELYRHMHLGGPPVTLEQTEPLLMDLKGSIAADEPIFMESGGRVTL